MSFFFSNYPSMKDVEIRREEFSEKRVLDQLKALRPIAVVFDFSSQLSQFKETFMKINHLKKCPNYKSIPTFSLFSSKKELEEMSFLFSLGLNYPFIKGSDEKILFNDIHYLSFETETPFSKFAKADLNQLPYEGLLVSGIYGFTQTSILIESDLSSNEEDLEKISLEFTGDKKTLEVRVQKTFELGVSGSYLYRGEYEVPFLGAWDDPSENLVLKDDYDCWLEENQDLFNQKAGRALIVSSRAEDYILAGELTLESSFDIYNASTFEETKTYLESYSFDLIFYRLDNKDDPVASESNFENLYRLSNAVRNLGKGDTIFVAFNSPSRTEALKKAIEYDHVLGVSDDLQKEKLSSLISVFEKKGRKISCETYCYEPFLNDAKCFFHLDLRISSITEHELTFYSSSEIPMYCLIKIDVPSELYLLVVPPTHQLEIEPKMNHYMSFIVGGEETDAEILRSFINHAVVSGLESFSKKAIELDPIEKALDREESSIDQEIEEGLAHLDDLSVENKERTIIRKTKINGKTKL